MVVPGSAPQEPDDLIARGIDFIDLDAMRGVGIVDVLTIDNEVVVADRQIDAPERG